MSRKQARSEGMLTMSEDGIFQSSAGRDYNRRGVACGYRVGGQYFVYRLCLIPELSSIPDTKYEIPYTVVMAKFSYTAEKTDGEVYTGVAEARDRFELYAIVRREGGKIVTVSDDGAHGFPGIDRINAMLTRVKEFDKILFARNLSAMLSAGLSLARALAVLERQTKIPSSSRSSGK